MRAFDWTRTPLGPPERWPHGLKTAVRIMLTSRQAMWIGWGPELTYLYNDPYKSIIGGKHPLALGQPTDQVWREIWDEIGPMLATAMQGDQGTYVEAAAADHGAQRLPGRDVLHVLLQSDAERYRRRRRDHLRQHRRHRARDPRAPAGAAAAAGCRRRRGAHRRRRVRAQRRSSAQQPARHSVRAALPALSRRRDDAAGGKRGVRSRGRRPGAGAAAARWRCLAAGRTVETNDMAGRRCRARRRRFPPAPGIVRRRRPSPCLGGSRPGSRRRAC